MKATLSQPNMHSLRPCISRTCCSYFENFSLIIINQLEIPAMLSLWLFLFFFLLFSMMMKANCFPTQFKTVVWIFIRPRSGSVPPHFVPDNLWCLHCLRPRISRPCCTYFPDLSPLNINRLEIRAMISLLLPFFISIFFRDEEGKLFHNSIQNHISVMSALLEAAYLKPLQYGLWKLFPNYYKPICKFQLCSHLKGTSSALLSL